jgi:WD40 repeat protein
VDSKKPLKHKQSLVLANALLDILTRLEQSGIAHSDISSSNVIVTSGNKPSLELVDVEQLYAPGLETPKILLASSPGYAHAKSASGLWQPEADRFAGAVLLAEILGWCDKRICAAAGGEIAQSYFRPGEEQTDCERYRLLHAVLYKKWGEPVADLFQKAWRAKELSQCPTFAEWKLAIACVSNLGPISKPWRSKKIKNNRAATYNWPAITAIAALANIIFWVLISNSDINRVAVPTRVLVSPAQASVQNTRWALMQGSFSTPTPREMPTLDRSRGPSPMPTATPTSLPTATPIFDFSVRDEAAIPPSITVIGPDNATQIEPLAILGRGEIYEIAYSSDGEFLAAASGNGVHLYNTLSQEEVAFLPSYNAVLSLAFAPDGQTLATGDEKGIVSQWSWPGEELLETLQGHTNGVRSLAFAPDGRVLATGDGGNTVRLWSWPEAELLEMIQIDNEWLISFTNVAFAPDGQTLAVWWDATVQLWSWPEGELLATLKKAMVIGGSTIVSSVVFAPDQRTLAVGVGHAVELWSWPEGELLRTLTGHTDKVTSVAFAPDGRTLASGADDGTVQLWSWPEGELLQVLEWDTGKVRSVAFSPDGQALASGADDGTVQLWSWPEGELLQVLEGHPSLVRSLAFAPDGQTMAIGVVGGVMQLWSWPEGAS